MKAFEFAGGTAEVFVKRVQTVLHDRGLGDYVSLRQEGDELVVSFRWMGSSELRYRLSINETGFRAELSGEKMSPFHSPFRHQFDDKFETVIEAVGAKVV